MPNSPDRVDMRADRRASDRVTLLSRDYLSARPLINWLRTVAPQYARGVLLDWGCGNTPYRQFFKGNVEKYIGVDVEQNVDGTVDIVLAPGHPLPFSDSSVDAVLSTQVLEHVNDPVWYVREAARVLRSGGYLILSCPGSYMLHEEPHDYFRYTRYGLEHLFGIAGLRLVRMDTSGGAWRLMGQVFLNHKTFARKWDIPLVSGAVYYGWIIAVNLICAFLDRVNINERDTANYMVVAQK